MGSVKCQQFKGVEAVKHAKLQLGSTAVVPLLACHTSKHKLNIHANLQKWQRNFGDGQEMKVNKLRGEEQYRYDGCFRA